MQPASVITLVFLLLLSVAHLFRLVFRVEIVAAEYVVPVWFSAFASSGRQCWPTSSGASFEASEILLEFLSDPRIGCERGYVCQLIGSTRY